MLIYNAIFLFLTLFALLDLSDKKNLAFFVIPCFTLFILTAFRGNGGDDFFVYEQYFNSIPDELFKYGYGYYILNVIVKNVGDYSLFIIISSSLCIILQSIFIYRESEKPCFVLFVFFATSFLWLDFILIRQSIAVGFFIIAMIYFKNNKNILALLFLCMASLFHETAIFAGLMFYILYRVNKSGAIISVLILILIAPFLSEVISIINNLTIKNNNVNLYINQRALPSLANIVELLAAFIAFYKIKNTTAFRSDVDRKCYKSILLSSLCILVLSYTIPSLARFLEYFRLFYFILLAKLLSRLDFTSRYLLLIVIVLYGFLRLNSFINQFDTGFDYIFNGSTL